MRRLREIYRSAGWPCADMLEVELLAAGLLERCVGSHGHETLRITDAGIHALAKANAGNQNASAFMSSWPEQNGSAPDTIEKEVAKVSTLMEEASHRKLCVANLGHVKPPPNKSNVVLGKGYRPLQKEDAEYALQSLG